VVVAFFRKNERRCRSQYSSGIAATFFVATFVAKSEARQPYFLGSGYQIHDVENKGLKPNVINVSVSK
jgi:hypothetical protein